MEAILKSLPNNSKLKFEQYIPTKLASPYPILFIHGMFESSQTFNLSMRHALRHGFEVYALNLEGHAPGQKVSDSSIENYAGNCLMMLQHIARPTILVGHSMGALIGQIVAEGLSEKYDDNSDSLVKAAVFMNSNVPGKSLFMKEMLRWRYIQAMITGRPFWFVEKDFLSLFFNNTPEKFQYFSSFTRESGKALRQIAFGLVSVDERKVVCPTLVLATGHDKVTPPSSQLELKEKYHSDYALIPEGDHMTFLWSTVLMDEIFKWIPKWHSPKLNLEPGRYCYSFLS